MSSCECNKVVLFILIVLQAIQFYVQITHVYISYRAVNHAVTIMCADRTEWSRQIRRYNREFSCDVISNQFCKSSNFRRYVGFLLHGRVWENTTKCPVTFYLVHITIPNYDRVTRILKHTLCWNFKSCYKVNQKKKHVLLFFAIPRHTERKPRSGVRYAPLRAWICPAPWFPFCIARYGEKQQNTLLFLNSFMTENKISTECAIILVTPCNFGIVVCTQINVSGHFLVFSYTGSCEEETNMAVESTMTCKIGLIWRHMKTLCRKLNFAEMLGTTLLHSDDDLCTPRTNLNKQSNTETNERNVL